MEEWMVRALPSQSEEAYRRAQKVKKTADEERDRGRGEGGPMSPPR